MRVALALGGGGARGLAHIHVLAALDEMGIVPVEIAGSSIGAIMAVARASGMSGRDVAEFAMSVLGNPPEAIATLLRTRGGGGPLPLLAPRLADLDPERVLRAFMPNHWPGLIEQLDIPVVLTATDFYEQALVELRSGPLLPSLAAAIALPAVFSPVQRDEAVLIDGGFTNPVPFDLLDRERADIVIACDVIGGPVRHPRRLPNKREQLFGASQCLMQAAIREKCLHAQPDVLIRPPVNGINVLNFLAVRRILAETASVKDEVKRELEAAMERRAA